MKLTKKEKEMSFGEKRKLAADLLVNGLPSLPIDQMLEDMRDDPAKVRFHVGQIFARN